jgi:hypothetical protein
VTEQQHESCNDGAFPVSLDLQLVPEFQDGLALIQRLPRRLKLLDLEEQVLRLLLPEDDTPSGIVPEIMDQFPCGDS